MKNLLLLVFALLCWGQSDAANPFVLTPSGIVSSEDSTKTYVVVEMPGKTQEEIYELLSVRLNRMYKYPNATQSRIEGKSIQISGTAPMVVFIKKDLGREYFWDLKHTINIEFRDGRVKFDVLGFSITNPFGYNTEVALVGKGHFNAFVYDRKENLKMSRTKEDVEKFFNSFVNALSKDDQAEEEEW